MSLKVKYTTDEHAAKMIDMIHDKLGSSFSVLTTTRSVISCFSVSPVLRKSNDFASVYEKGIGACETKLQR